MTIDNLSISLLISSIALLISAFTAWATFLRRGVLKMTQPTVIYFGPDASHESYGSTPPKIYLRTLLFSTGKRGRMIESMHVKITRNETVQNFNIWVYGEEKLVRGSGLFVGENGITANHHFLTPKDGSAFSFVAGVYRIDLFAKVLGSNSDVLLWSERLEILKEHEKALNEPRTGLYFDWGPDSNSYLPHVQTGPPLSDSSDFLEILRLQKLSTEGNESVS